MNKILFVIIYLLCDSVYAVSNITIDNQNVIPSFDSTLKNYNYYTNKDKVTIKIDDKIDEVELNDNYIEYKYDDYKISIFKDYNKDNEESVYLDDLRIKGYNINFNKDIYEYYISIADEDNLDISYDLSNDNCYVVVSGNGNFNNSDNIISIKIDNNIEYKIHALKTLNVSLVEEEKKEFPIIKKEIVKYIVITISCIVVFLFYYLMFNKKHFYI